MAQGPAIRKKLGCFFRLSNDLDLDGSIKAVNMIFHNPIIKLHALNLLNESAVILFYNP